MNDVRNRLRVQGNWSIEPVEGPNGALYVMAAPDATHAKVGVRHAVANCGGRLKAVLKAHPSWCEVCPREALELAVVCELEGFVLGAKGSAGRLARWELLRHLESAVSLDLALRLGRRDEKPEWIALDSPHADADWSVEVEASWLNVGSMLEGR